MNDNDKDFSPKQSLQLIQSMIETTRHSIKDSSHFFLLWGWAVMLGCVLQYVLMVVFRYPHHYYAWFITPVALLIHIVFVIRQGKRQRVKTFVGEASAYLWISIGCSFMVLSFIFARIGWQYCFPFYILFYGVGTFVSGSLIQFKPLVIGGVCCFVFAAIAAYISYDHQMLLTALAILVSYIIPGHLLRNHFRKHNS
jgi:hypothetical protein